MSPRNWHIPGQPEGRPPKGGRPSKGERTLIAVRVHPDVLAVVQAELERLRATLPGASLSDAAEELIRRGAEQRPG